MSTVTVPKIITPISNISQRGQRAPEQPIARLMGMALTNPNAISLAAGFVDNATLPCSEVATACSLLLSDTRLAPASLQYGSNLGNANLRNLIAHRYFQNDPELYADRMLLTAGSNQFLHLVSECILDPGDIVLCAAPTYFVYLYMLRDIQARGYGIGIDEEGMNPVELENALQALEENGQLHRVKALYLVPYCDNPSATTMSAQRRQAIIEVLARWRDRAAITLLVDNAYRDLRYEGEDIPSFTDLGSDPNLTVETGTFSKNLSPGLRIGWGTPPEPLKTAIDRRKSLIDFGSPHFNQMLVAQILDSGMFDQHVETLRTAYRIKRDATIAACQKYFGDIEGAQFQTPAGGIYVWLQLPEEYDLGPDGPIWSRAMENGVLYVPGEFFYTNEGHKILKSTARLSFGILTPDRIDEGVRLLAEACKASR